MIIMSRERIIDLLEPQFPLQSKEYSDFSEFAVSGRGKGVGEPWTIAPAPWIMKIRVACISPPFPTKL